MQAAALCAMDRTCRTCRRSRTHTQTPRAPASTAYPPALSQGKAPPGKASVSPKGRESAGDLPSTSTSARQARRPVSTARTGTPSGTGRRSRCLSYPAPMPSTATLPRRAPPRRRGCGETPRAPLRQERGAPRRKGRMRQEVRQAQKTMKSCRVLYHSTPHLGCAENRSASSCERMYSRARVNPSTVSRPPTASASSFREIEYPPEAVRWANDKSKSPG